MTARGSRQDSHGGEIRCQACEAELYGRSMLNLTLGINCAATVALAASVVVMDGAALVAIALAYVSGLLTSLASRWQVGVAAEPPPSTSGHASSHVP